MNPNKIWARKYLECCCNIITGGFHQRRLFGCKISFQCFWRVWRIKTFWSSFQERCNLLLLLQMIYFKAILVSERNKSVSNNWFWDVLERKFSFWFIQRFTKESFIWINQNYWIRNQFPRLATYADRQFNHRTTSRIVPFKWHACFSLAWYAAHFRG